MGFPERLSASRKSADLTQLELAERASISAVQLRRYEAGKAQPTLDAIKHLAVALNVTTDSLIFDNSEREPGDDLRLQFESIEQFTPEEKEVARSVIDGLILKHHANRFSGTKPKQA